MRLESALLIVFALSLCTAGCSSSECTDVNTPGCVVTSGSPRNESPCVTTADLSAAVADNTAFALDLYQGLRTSPGNLFYSPFSISEALAMTWACARGQTEAQMSAALHFTLGQVQQHAAFDALDLSLKAANGGGVTLDVANALRGQTGSAFDASFLDVLRKNYGAGMHVANFAACRTTHASSSTAG